MVVGILIERVIIRHFYGRPPEDQILVTFGLAICLVELVRFGFGSLSRSVPPPPWGAGVTNLGFMLYPTYRLAVVAIVAVALGILYIVLYRTRLGMIVRAGIEDSVMVDSLGINVFRVFMIVFGIGAMAAGFAGIVNAPVVSLTPDMGEAILVQTFVVVVIGGVGSFPGAILGGLIAGQIISITSMINPGYSYVMLFAAMTLVLLLRPRGLFGAGAVIEHAPAVASAPLPGRGAHRARPRRGALRAAALGLRAQHGQPDPGLGPVRHRLRHPVRLHRPALVRAVGLLRHRRLHRRLPADPGRDLERAAGAASSARWGRRWWASPSACWRCGGPASISP